jgi:hypothetical protein
VVRVQERVRLLGRQPLDAQRAGQRDQGQAAALGADLGGAGGRVVVTGVDREVGLAVEMQGPAGQARRSAAPPEALDEPVGPQMLVNVYPQSGLPVSVLLSVSVKRLSETLHWRGCQARVLGFSVLTRPPLS